MNCKQAMEIYHKISSAKYGNKKTRLKDYSDAFLEATDTLISNGYFYIKNDYSVFPVRSSYPTSKNYLENFININNRYGRIFTYECIKTLLICENDFRKKDATNFTVILKIILSVKNDKQLYKDCLDLFVKDMNFCTIFDVKEVSSFLKNYPNYLLKLFLILTKGGTLYEKKNTLLCVLSFFYIKKEIPEDRLSEFLRREMVDSEDYIFQHYSIDDLGTLKNSYFIMNLIENGLLNINHIFRPIKVDLKADYYIPKKKNRKRIYTEDKKELLIFLRELPLEEMMISHIEYEASEERLVRDKNSSKKRYIPAISEKRSNKKDIYIINMLEGSKSKIIDILEDMIDIYEYGLPDSQPNYLDVFDSELLDYIMMNFSDKKAKNIDYVDNLVIKYTFEWQYNIT